MQPPSRRVLVVSNAYPRPNDLYRYQFLHARVLAYRESGLWCDVFVVDVSSPDDDISSYQFEDVTVLVGSPQAFGAYLEDTAYEKLLVHFPMPYMLEAIDCHAPRTPVILWLHGYEAEAWWRRWFNHLDGERLPGSTMRGHRRAADARLEALAAFLDRYPDTTVVTVSHWFRRHCIEPDIGRPLPNATSIPNYIDGDLFRPAERSASAQRRVLVLRPFTSAKYAGRDIVDAIRLITNDDPSIQFTLCGDGPDFENAVRPLAGLANVNLRRGFRSRSGVAELHRDHGIFLNPTWWDSQGVSTCEAMASGLAVVSTDVSAVPEFVEDGVTGLLVAPGDVAGLAGSVRRLVTDDDLRQQISRAATRKVADQCGFEATIRREIELILGRMTPRPEEPIDWKARYAELADEFTEVICRLGANDA